MPDNIEYVEMQFVDMLGRLKAMVVPCDPADSIEVLARDPILRKGASVDGSSVTGMASVEMSDLRLDPDLSTLIELPYTAHRTAAVMCFLRDKMPSQGSRSYHPKDSRSVLHRVCESLLPDQMHVRVKAEPEFYFITSEGDKVDEGCYADTYPTSPAADVLIELASYVKQIGMRPLVAHHEGGHSQQEIEIDFDDVRRMSDYIVLFKNFAKVVTQDHGLDVTFMPKPFRGSAGSGMHAHLQLWDAKKNLFGSETGADLSDTAKSFIAGLLEHAPAITAIANPTINSYKRLVPRMEAPVYICWGYRNRTVLVRIPLFAESQKAAVEFRSPDGICNPYLLFSALIAAGMDGVDRALTSPEPRSEDVFALTDEERDRLGIRTLPTTLEEALNCLEQDSLIREALGSQLCENYVRIKRDEWREYVSGTVTDWEWEKYSTL